MYKQVDRDQNVYYMDRGLYLYQVVKDMYVNKVDRDQNVSAEMNQYINPSGY